MAARTDFARLLELERDDYAALRLLGEAAYLWLYRGARDEALAIFEALTELAPNDPTGPLGLAEVHLAAGKGRAAAEAARKARRAPHAGHAIAAFTYLLEAKALLLEGKRSEAEKALAQALEVDPGGAVGETARELIELLGREQSDASPASPPNDER